mgnify:CR=1 FL=1
MPRITLPTLPATDEPLLREKNFSDVNDPYTASVYTRTDAPNPDSGIMSTLNGRLSVSNLDNSFQLRAEHIQPEQATLARSASMLTTSTIYGNGAIDPVIGVQAGTQFFTLPGCSLRWYQPYDTTVSLMNWSFFVSFNCWRGAYLNLESDFNDNVNTPITLRCVLDGSAISGTKRYLGQNMFHPLSPGGETKSDGPTVGPGCSVVDFWGNRQSPTRVDVMSITAPKPDTSLPYGELTSKNGGNPQYVQTEAHSATQFDLHHMTSLSKGWHEISVECSIATPDDPGVLVQNKGNKNRGPLKSRGYFRLLGKLSLGIRNARVLNLL